MLRPRIKKPATAQTNARAQIPTAKKSAKKRNNARIARREQTRRTRQTRIRTMRPNLRALSHCFRFSFPPSAFQNKRIFQDKRTFQDKRALQRGARLAAACTIRAANAHCPPSRKNFARKKSAGRERQRRFFRALRRETARECRAFWIRQNRACRHSGARESARSQTRTTNQARRRAEPGAALAESPPFPEYNPSL